VSERFRVVPTVTFQEDVERLEEHIVQRELASHTPDDTCLFRYENDYR
jgi:hypothetical protein